MSEENSRDRLGHRFDYALEKCRSLGLPVFNGTPPNEMKTVWWEGDTDEDWSAFMSAAKAAGAKIILLSRDAADRGRVEACGQRFSEVFEQWDKVAVAVSASAGEDLPEPPSAGDKEEIMATLTGAAGHHGQTGFVQASWIMDGVAYAVAEYEEWWDAFTDAEEFLENIEGIVGKNAAAKEEQTPKHVTEAKHTQSRNTQSRMFA